VRTALFVDYDTARQNHPINQKLTPPPLVFYYIIKGENLTLLICNYAAKPRRGLLMKKSMLAVVIALFVAASASYAQIKYVAVVETDLDEQSGAAAKISRADVRQMTAELRSVAVKTLPRDRYNIMTSETVMAQGGAKLEECSEENCVIILGNMIGADYIVRGIMSKLGASLTMAVEMYETQDGNLVASSGLVRAENIADLLDKTAAACADMYRAFLSTQVHAQKAPLTHTVAVAADPPDGGSVSRNPDQQEYALGTIVSITATPASGYTIIGWSGSSTSKKATLAGPIDRDLTLTANFQYVQTPEESGAADKGGWEYENEKERKPMKGFLIGYNFAPGKGGHSAFQLGFVYSSPVSEKVVSLNAEFDAWAGTADHIGDDGSPNTSFFALSVPLTLLFQWSIFSLEAGVDMDALIVDDALFNAGIVVGAGVGFGKERSRRYFYRYCAGINYNKHLVGMWWLF
jgi:hypothetical protein